MALRLFIGLDVPYEMRRNLELLLQLLKPAASIQWSQLSNLHVTTKFIGAWAEDRLTELTEALASIPSPGVIPIAIRGLGWFPNPHHPRVFFVGLQAPPTLAALAADTESACESIGIPREDREFKPHLTLARIKSPTDLSTLLRTIAGLPSVDFGAFTAEQFHLYKSELRPGGSIYTKLASYPLTGA
jgi:RNA 2',3'-cyclic 3'-phosphodiesterase